MVSTSYSLSDYIYDIYEIYLRAYLSEFYLCYHAKCIVCSIFQDKEGKKKSRNKEGTVTFLSIVFLVFLNDFLITRVLLML